jgi:hypothetical protein
MNQFTKNATMLTITAVMALLPFLGPKTLAADAKTTTSSKPTISISVFDVTTGQPILQGETITAGDQFQATVTVNNDINCAGQFVVTAIGAPGAPPEVLVQLVPIIIGPAVGTNSATGGILTSNGTPGHPNYWKVSASCNGVTLNAFGFAQFQFTSAV